MGRSLPGGIDIGLIPSGFASGNPLKFDANHGRALTVVNHLARPSHILRVAKLSISEKPGLGVMAVVGFLVNPIAGMGGRVGLKGTDDVVAEARRRGAEPNARARALSMLQILRDHLKRESSAPAIEWLTCAGEMGADVLAEAGFAPAHILPESRLASSSRDTTAAAAEFVSAGVDLVLFCGGDGTARDIASIIGRRIPLLGVPSGVKMYSGVFGVSPARTAEIVMRFLKGELRPVEAEILDLDEEKYRAGKWVVRLFQTVLTPFEPTYTQVSKQLVFETSDVDAKADIASYLAEIIAADGETLFLLGPGNTIETVAREIGVRKTLLGIDAVVGGLLAGEDMSEQDILVLLARHSRCRLVLSPIGAQGFVLGRGNLQLSPEVLRRIGIRSIMVAATPAKLAHTPVLRFDTGDAALDAEIAALGYLPVIVGYRRHRLVKIVV
jgi:predicted polyphosphate/ATP-dependent NAD kinase